MDHLSTFSPTLSVGEVAIDLSVCEHTVRRMLRRGELPHIRIGGGRLIRIRREDLEAYKRANSTLTK